MPQSIQVPAQSGGGQMEALRHLRPEVWIATAVLLPLVIAYAVTTGSETVVVAVAAAAVAVGAIVARPFWGLMLFVSLVYVRPEDTFAALQGVPITLAVSVATLAGVWLQLHLHGEKAVRHPVIVCMLGFWLACILSTVSGGDPVAAAMDVGKLLILVWLILNLVKTPERYRTWERSLILLTAWVAAVVIYRALTGQVLHLEEGDRAAGTGVIGDPNDSAAVIAAGLSLALNAALAPRGRWRWLCWPIASAMVWAIYLTQSRGGMLALMVAVGGTFLLRSKRKVLGLGLAGVAALGLLAMGSGHMANFDNQEASANSRVWFWSNGIAMLISHPLTGVGYGQFVANNDGRAPHGTFTQAMGEVGAPGYFCWIGTLYWAFAGRRRCARNGSSVADTVIEPGPLLAIAAYLTAVFFLSHAYMTYLYILATLPVLQQCLPAVQDPSEQKSSPLFECGDALRIAGLVLASPLLVKLLVWRLG